VERRDLRHRTEILPCLQSRHAPTLSFLSISKATLQPRELLQIAAGNGVVLPATTYGPSGGMMAILHRQVHRRIWTPLTL
jgi:hypothetical protein